MHTTWSMAMSSCMQRPPSRAARMPLVARLCLVVGLTRARARAYGTRYEITPARLRQVGHCNGAEHAARKRGRGGGRSERLRGVRGRRREGSMRYQGRWETVGSCYLSPCASSRAKIDTGQPGGMIVSSRAGAWRASWRLAPAGRAGDVAGDRIPFSLAWTELLVL